MPGIWSNIVHLSEAASASPVVIKLFIRATEGEASCGHLYKVFIKYCVFSLIFLNSVSSAAALVFYRPGVCVHQLTPRENRERPGSGIFLKNSEKTHYLMNILYLLNALIGEIWSCIAPLRGTIKNDLPTI